MTRDDDLRREQQWVMLSDLRSLTTCGTGDIVNVYRVTAQTHIFDAIFLREIDRGVWVRFHDTDGTWATKFIPWTNVMSINLVRKFTAVETPQDKR